MKRVNIITEVSDEVMEFVVSPHKAEKRFGKLVSTLLEAYYTNPQIQNFVNGKFENDAQEGISALHDQLLKANVSLATLGIIADNSQNNLNSALDEISSTDVPKVENSSSELDDFKDEIRESQTKFMQEMRSMMSEFMSSSKPVVQVPVQESKPVEPSVPSSSVDEVDWDDLDIGEIKVKSTPTETTTSSDDLLNNLLRGNIKTFGGAN